MNTKLVMGIVVAIVIIIVALIINPFVIISAGERGIVLNWGAVSDTILSEGIHFRIPVVQKVIQLDVKTVKHEVDAVAYSKDIQTVNSKVALNYHLDPTGVNKLWQEIGKDYESRIIDPAIQESVKAATAKFTAQELIGERQKVKDEIKNQLLERLNGRHILVDDLSIVNFDFSSAYEKAVEEKQVSQQNALKAENDLKRIKVEAEQRIAQAEAEARAIQVQSNAADNDKYIQLKSIEAQVKAIEKWNGVLPTQMIPSATLPFLNLVK